MTKSLIEWTDDTINPIRARHIRTGKVGWFCTRVSPGCKFCYAAKMNGWRGNGVDYAEDQAKHIRMFLDEKMLGSVLRWRKPRKIFWCDMTDMFHSMVSDECLHSIFAVMALTPQHTHQVLTKRPERMRRFCNALDTRQSVGLKILDFVKTMKIPSDTGYIRMPLVHRPDSTEDQPKMWAEWPLPNVWFGTSIEDQTTADKRIPILLETKATVRWLSYEPALGAVDIRRALPRTVTAAKDMSAAALESGASGEYISGIDWVVCGGESGHQARAFNINWAYWVKGQCAEAGVPLFMKQMGSLPIDTQENCRKTKMKVLSKSRNLARIPADFIPLKFLHSKGGDWNEWPEDLKVREFPKVSEPNQEQTQ